MNKISDKLSIYFAIVTEFFCPSKEPVTIALWKFTGFPKITRYYPARIAEYKMEADMDEERVVLKQSDVRTSTLIFMQTISVLC